MFNRAIRKKLAVVITSASLAMAVHTPTPANAAVATEYAFLIAYLAIISAQPSVIESDLLASTPLFQGLFTNDLLEFSASDTDRLVVDGAGTVTLDIRTANGEQLSTLSCFGYCNLEMIVHPETGPAINLSSVRPGQSPTLVGTYAPQSGDVATADMRGSFNAGFLAFDPATPSELYPQEGQLIIQMGVAP
jgi:hypothetical protein